MRQTLKLANHLKEQQIQALELLNSNLTERDALSICKEFIKSKFITVIIGHRRSGKTTLALQSVKDKDFLYFNFDDEILSDFKAQELNDLLEVALTISPQAKYLIFDEIQNIQKWELFINRIQRKSFHIILTGSNSRLLSQELSTHLTGRHLIVELFTFSFNEFLRFKNVDFKLLKIEKTETRSLMYNYFLQYLESGSFPEILNLDSKGIVYKSYIKELYEKIIFRDVLQRRKIRNTKALKEIALIALSNFASRFTFQAIKRSSTINSINTVKNYIDYLQEAYIQQIIEPFSFKIKERVSLPKKIYPIDNSYINVILNKKGEDLGKKLECIVFIELKRRGLECYCLIEPKYEVDFAIKEGRSLKQLIQVCWSMENEETKKREIYAIIEAAKKFKVKELKIITENAEEILIVEEHQIEIIPAWKWLLIR